MSSHRELPDPHPPATTAARAPCRSIPSGWTGRCAMPASTSSISARHNVRYMLGGYRHHYYANEESLGLSRYQPVVGYVAGAPQQAFFVGSWMDRDPLALHPIWVADVRAVTTDGTQTGALVVDALRSRGLTRGTIGIEPPFLSVEAYRPIADSLTAARFVDAVPVLEHLRAVKRPHELRLLREASERTVDSMLAVFARAGAGDTAVDLERWMNEEQLRRHVEFLFTFIALGTDGNRTPSHRPLERGLTISLDSAGKLEDYIGDLARMAIVGDPDEDHVHALEAVDLVQMAAREPIRAGAIGSAIYDAADQAVSDSPFGADIAFVAHGIGLVSHEAPRLAQGTANPHRYPAAHRDLLLEAGMAVSIETTLAHPRLGYVKLEDTVAVTTDGCEGYGDGGRSWNVIDTKRKMRTGA